MFLFKDYLTNKKSITVTVLIISIMMTWGSIILNAVLLAIGRNTDTNLIFASMTMTAPMLGLYWNKRVRVSKDGLTFEKESNEQSA